MGPAVMEEGGGGGGGGGGGEQQASCLVAKQAVEFHRYWLVYNNRVCNLVGHFVLRVQGLPDHCAISNGNSV